MRISIFMWQWSLKTGRSNNFFIYYWALKTDQKEHAFFVGGWYSYGSGPIKLVTISVFSSYRGGLRISIFNHLERRLRMSEIVYFFRIEVEKVYSLVLSYLAQAQ